MDAITELLAEGKVGAVLFIVLCIATVTLASTVAVMWRKQGKLEKRLEDTQDKYTELLVEVTQVLERIPSKIDTSWKQAVSDLKLHILELMRR